MFIFLNRVRVNYILHTAIRKNAMLILENIIVCIMVCEIILNYQSLLVTCE